MAPWLQLVERILVEQLLRLPAFHRGVEQVVKRVHRFQHGIPPEEQRHSKLDPPPQSGFAKHFLDEVKSQLSAAEKRKEIGATGISGGVDARRSATARTAASHDDDDHTAEGVWRRANTQYTAPPSQQKSVPPKATVDESAEAVWRTAQASASTPPSQGFLGQYMSALREQVKGDRRGR